MNNPSLFSKPKDSLTLANSAFSNPGSATKSYVKNFFKNTIQRVLNKLKEYAKKGVQFLLDVLGIQVNGSSELTIKF